MSDLTLRTAKRIKMYRKQNNMSVHDLAMKINKSAATLYKYESAQIPVDMDTLSKISDALGVAPVYFFDLPQEKSKANQWPSFLENGMLYAYYYDGRIKRISKSLLTFTRQDDGDTYAMFYCI